MKLRSAAAAARNAHPLARSWTWLQKNLRENWHLKLLSLVVAFALFAVARQPSREILLVNVPLEYINIASGLEISGDFQSHVNVRVSGPRDVVQGLTASQLEVKADLGNKTAGERVIQINPADVNKPNKVEIRRIEPQSIELTLEPTRHKTVPIKPQLVGAPPAGYEYWVTQLLPPSVEIEGPESKVAAVESIPTETIQLDGRQQDFQLRVDLETSRQGVRLTNVAPTLLTVRIRPKKNSE
ncbi:MAG: CdaR family protein [Blastocatellia bacterium]